MKKTTSTSGRRSKSQARPRQRPKLTAISEEMRRFAALLGQELAGWPAVKVRPMFGMEAFYRRDKIFAALPRTRAMATGDSIAIKLPNGAPRNFRLDSLTLGKAWATFEMSSSADLNHAIRLLEAAYRQAR